MKKELENKDWLLIAKHLGKELDEEQNKQLNQWLAESDKNRKELSEAEKIWELSDTKDSNLFSTDRGWKKMSDRIHQGSSKRIMGDRRIFLQPLRIAASILVLIGLATFVYLFIGNSKFVNVTATNEKILAPIVLPDGTKVSLNIGSTIKYPKSFEKSATRTVELTGEAFFDVTHNAAQPFIIHTPKAQVKVLGTSFDVEAYQNSDSVQVVVKTGIVELSSITNNDAIKLTKGSSGVYYVNNNKLIKTVSSDVNAFAWKTNEIIFDNANLDYVSKTLSRLFHSSIRFENESLKKCRYDANFIHGEDLDSILKTIKETLNLEIKKINNTYIISGAECKT